MSFLVTLAVVGYFNFWNDSGENYKRSKEERNVTHTITKVRIDELKKDVNLTKEVNSSNRKRADTFIKAKEAKKKSNPTLEKVVEVKVDFKEFVTEWNVQVAKLANNKYDLDKYMIDETKDVLEQVNNFIYYEEGERKLEERILKKIRAKDMYITLKKWIKERKKKFKENKISGLNNTSELRKAIRENLNFPEPFSKDTIEEILTWNEFTLYFEKNKTDDDDEEYDLESCMDIEDRINKKYSTLDLNICIDNPKN